MRESWKCIAVGLVLVWSNDLTRETAAEIVAAHYRVGAEARTCETGSGACYVYVVAKSDPDGPLRGALAWRRPGVELAAFDAGERTFWLGSTVAVYP